MEIVTVQIEALPDVFILHSLPRHHLGTDFFCFLWQTVLVAVEPFTELLGVLFGEQHLVDNNIVGIDTEFGKFLYQTFCFVDGKELGDTDADKGGQRRILESIINLVNDFSCFLETPEEHVLHLSRVASSEHGTRLSDESTESILQFHNFSERLLQDGGETQQTQGVPGGSGIEDNDIKVEFLDLFHEFGEGHGLVDTGDTGCEFAHEGLDAGILLVGFFHASLHFFHVIVGVDFHGGQVVEAVDGGGFATDFLAEGIRQVVSGVGGNNEDLLSALC
mmetsp:Transcript_3475/g.5085  ORF Transcript_3475/g.5085 Transcript_3475/m.5085 type:complete len:277 (-) Transcript_3475:399-1229(-)